MARLRITSPAFEPAEWQLGPGRALIGREGQIDFIVPHPSVSRQHCELLVMDDALLVRDLGSRNGTFVNGERVQVSQVHTGQTLRLGEVDMFVEEAPVRITVPDVALPEQAKATFMPDGSPCCLHHPGVAARVQCSNCQQVFCSGCVRELRVAGGMPRRFCPDCGGYCDPIPANTVKAKRGWLGRLKDVFTKSGR